MSATMEGKEDLTQQFLKNFPEKLKLNQYWYSARTLAAMVEEVEEHGTKVAFLSTPSVYFSIRSAKIREQSKLFDFDEQWKSDPGYVFYNYKEPEKIPVEFHHKFDYVVVDPPFITDEVWSKYADAIKLVLKKDDKGKIAGKMLLSTIRENCEFLKEWLDAVPQRFQPSIPHLIYQYDFYTNYESKRLSQPNPEIEQDDVGAGKKGWQPK